MAQEGPEVGEDHREVELEQSQVVVEGVGEATELLDLAVAGFHVPAFGVEEGDAEGEVGLGFSVARVEVGRVGEPSDPSLGVGEVDAASLEEFSRYGDQGHGHPFVIDSVGAETDREVGEDEGAESLVLSEFASDPSVLRSPNDEGSHPTLEGGERLGAVGCGVMEEEVDGASEAMLGGIEAFEETSGQGVEGEDRLDEHGERDPSGGVEGEKAKGEVRAGVGFRADGERERLRGAGVAHGGGSLLVIRGDLVAVGRENEGLVRGDGPLADGEGDLGREEGLELVGELVGRKLMEGPEGGIGGGEAGRGAGSREELPHEVRMTGGLLGGGSQEVGEERNGQTGLARVESQIGTGERQMVIQQADCGVAQLPALGEGRRSIRVRSRGWSGGGRAVPRESVELHGSERNPIG